MRYCLQTKNVKNVSIAGESFESSLDHSKWAVTTDQSRAKKGSLKYHGNWICIGDINREVSFRCTEGRITATIETAVYFGDSVQ